MLPSRFADSPWKASCCVITVLALIILRRWLRQHRIRGIRDEMTPDSRRRISEESGLGRTSDEKTQRSPYRITGEDSPTVSLQDNDLDRQIMQYEEMRWNRPCRIIEEETPLMHPESPRVTPQPGLQGITTLRMEAPCTHCRNSEVILKEKLDIKAGRPILGGIGPSFYLTCTVGKNSQPIEFLIDTGCTSSAVDLKLIIELGLLSEVDRSNYVWYEAMGGVKRPTYGTIIVPVKTKSGFCLIESLMVIETTLSSPLIGLEVLAANNCSIILDVDLPWLLARSSDGCPTLKDLSFRNSADVMAKFNGDLYKCTLDTGSSKTFIPETLDLEQIPLSSSAYFNVAAENPIRLSKKVTDLEVEIDECVGHVTPLVLTGNRTMIGTDFLQNKRIDFFHGRVYVKPLMWAKKRPNS